MVKGGYRGRDKEGDPGDVSFDRSWVVGQGRIARRG